MLTSGTNLLVRAASLDCQRPCEDAIALSYSPRIIWSRLDWLLWVVRDLLDDAVTASARDLMRANCQCVRRTMSF